MYHYRAMLEARCSVMVVVLAATAASAQPKPAVPPLVHAFELVKVAPTWGFVDDAIGGDDTRVIYTVSDAATRSELHVVQLEDPKKETIVDLAPFTLHPIAIPWQRGDLVWVVGETEDGRQSAALVSLSKKAPIVAKLPAATGFTAIVQDGWKLASHREVASKDGTRHEAELYDVWTGKRVAAGRGLELDASGASKSLEFHVNHWTAGMTRAIGVKGGEWDKKENQRSPDVEATYDLVKGAFVDRKPITDLFEQRKRFQILAEAHDRVDFVRLVPDASAIQVWRDGKLIASELDQPLAQYDPKSLQGIVLPGVGTWAAIKIDPVNPDAVARKKADPEYLDVFHDAADGKKLQLGARVLATGTRYRFGAFLARFWLLEHSPSSERGGKTLTVYQIR
jgi:hypothetical protein